jgi:hypothetical protein
MVQKVSSSICMKGFSSAQFHFSLTRLFLALKMKVTLPSSTLGSPVCPSSCSTGFKLLNTVTEKWHIFNRKVKYCAVSTFF